MKALMNSGMDLKSGKSKTVTMKDLEKITGLRQVSNGGKIIRDDAIPFNKFQIERHYDPSNLTLEAVTFKGYRTVGYERKVIAERIQRRKEKIEAMQKLVEEDMYALLNLYDKVVAYGENHQLFSENDIGQVFTE